MHYYHRCPDTSGTITLERPISRIAEVVDRFDHRGRRFPPGPGAFTSDFITTPHEENGLAISRPEAIEDSDHTSVGENGRGPSD